MMEVVPPRLKKIWTDWQLRVLVLFSLLLQLLLILLGNRRRCSPKLWIRVTVWCAYLLADTIATMGLGSISISEGDDGLQVVEASSDENYIIIEAHNLLEKFKGLFADLLLSSQVVEKSRSLFLKMPADKTFEVIETELGFMYDLVYTKAKVIYTPLGLGSRFLTLALTCSVLLLYSFGHDKKKYNNVDESITFLLLVVAVFLEIYAAMVLLFSDETKFWLIKHRRTAVVEPFKLFKPLFGLPRGSGLMGQCSLLSLCVEEKPGFKLLGPYRFMSYSKVNPDLRSLILEQVQQQDSEFQLGVLAVSLEERLRKIVGKYNDEPVSYKIFTPTYYVNNELDKNILTWHIATELCYYGGEDEVENNCESSSRKLSLSISRYLVYLLVYYPFMLPLGISSIKIRDLVADTRRLDKDELPHRLFHIKIEEFLSNVWYKLDEKYDFQPIKVRGFREKNAIVQGCSLSRRLEEMSEDKNTKWDLIKDVWLEMLAYAAQQSKGSNHLQQLRRGGELLTHVWLLYAHCGMTGQILSVKDLHLD
ncbi:hypothetical protein COLO4_13588 [Corchorus olitorius]|uniref:DUF4220 domain-containing protein n=1 Tax=Corchorus olitorius TaxID=93759 RepID=A0A1R3JVU3_9ROSI|nr:hypothetical protein COLO4_13588 [Corchorus olitorius]